METVIITTEMIEQLFGVNIGSIKTVGYITDKTTNECSGVKLTIQLKK